MEDTAEDRGFLANLVIEVVSTHTTAETHLPVLLSYVDLATAKIRLAQDLFTFKNAEFKILEKSLSDLIKGYKPETHEVAFEYNKGGDYVLIDGDHALRMMLLLCMKMERPNQVISGTLKWAKKGHFNGEIQFSWHT